MGLIIEKERTETVKEIIGVRFKRPGKIYFFDPKQYKLRKRSICNSRNLNG